MEAFAANKQYQKDVQVLRAEIRALYKKMDEQFNLHGADLPVEFSMDDREKLGAYRPGDYEYEESFCFSLPFVAYSSKMQLRKEDREDLYKHEYAHYMRHHMEIPKEYDFESGHHGSGWRWCCSLIDAVPSPYYKVGESLKQKNYEQALKNTWKDNGAQVRMQDTYKRIKESRIAENGTVRFNAGDRIRHPKFGEGTIEKAEPVPGSVRLTIRFGEDVKVIDQKWLIKAQCVRIN